MALYLDAALLVVLFLIALNYMRHSLWTSLLDAMGWIAVYLLAVFLTDRTDVAAAGGEHLLRSALAVLASIALIYLLLRPFKYWMRHYYINSFTIATAALVSPVTLLLLVTIFSWLSTAAALEYLGWNNSQVMALFGPVIQSLNDIMALFGLEPHHPATDLDVTEFELDSSLLDAQ